MKSNDIDHFLSDVDKVILAYNQLQEDEELTNPWGVMHKSHTCIILFQGTYEEAKESLQEVRNILYKDNKNGQH